MPVRLRGRGSMFESLREYVPGDDLADVAWKATARHGRLITRNYETERSQNVLVVLDCGRLMVPQVDRAFAARLCDQCLAAAELRGDEAGRLHRAGGVQRPHRSLRAAGEGPGRACRRMNEALYRLEARLREPNYEQVCKFLALRHRKRSLIVILTDVIDKEASSMLLAYTAAFCPLPSAAVRHAAEPAGRAAGRRPSRGGRRLFHQDRRARNARPAGGSLGPHAAVGR